MGCANSSTVVDMQEVSFDRSGRSSDKLSQWSSNTAVRGKPFKQGSMGDFNFMGKLGQGAYATVHRARSSKLGDSVVAVKVVDLREKGAEEWDAKQLSDQRLYAMQEEVAILTRVNGRANVIDFYGSFRDGCLSFFVMEKCDCSLLQAIDRLPAITETSVCRILREMLNGLAAVHEVGVVHRDVKPDNFLCVGAGDTVKLCDFGLASALPRNGDGLTGVFGTPPFMSPEMLLGKPYDQKSDAWSFGVIVYSLFYGRFPYEPFERSGKAMKELIRSGVPVPAFRPPAALTAAQKVSDGAKHFAMDLLNRNPDHRISAEWALNHHFFATPGKTNLEPMLESSRTFGSFCTIARNDPSRKNEVDNRLEALQRQRDMALKAAAIKVHVPTSKEEDDEVSTHVASDYTGVHSPVSTLQSFEGSASAANGTGVDGSPRTSIRSLST